MNNVSLVGRLVRDIEVKTISNGKVATSFTLAVNRRKRDSGADFIKCSAYGQTAEILRQYVHKGQEVAIDGHLHTGNYERDGKKISTCEVVVDSVDLL